ncbi:LacI family transcriptional regulator [Massilia sp. H-1]|nr:LacI family transcriptional regulator [Massilia sp. H-1]
MATLKDVAQLAGVGLGTASRVVSGKGAVSPKTLARVRKAIEELDFQPSHAARSLMSGTSQMVGVYIPFLSGTFYTPILQLVYAELRAVGLNMVVGFGTGSVDERQQAVEGIDFLNQRGCDGVLVMTNALKEEDIVALGPRKSRMVLLNHCLPGMEERCFTVDHKLGGRMAARCSRKNTRRSPSSSSPNHAPDNVERIDGFMQELGEAGINTDKLWITESNFAPEGGWDSAKALLESGYRIYRRFLRQRRDGGRRLVVLPASRCGRAGRGLRTRLRRHAQRRIHSAPPVVGPHAVDRDDAQRPQLPAQSLLRHEASNHPRLRGHGDGTRLAQQSKKPD